MISGTNDDVWGEDAQELYDALCAAGKTAEIKTYDSAHRFRDDMRENAYDFLDGRL